MVESVDSFESFSTLGHLESSNHPLLLGENWGPLKPRVHWVRRIHPQAACRLDTLNSLATIEDGRKERRAASSQQQEVASISFIAQTATHNPFEPFCGGACAFWRLICFIPHHGLRNLNTTTVGSKVNFPERPTTWTMTIQQLWTLPGKSGYAFTCPSGSRCS